MSYYENGAGGGQISINATTPSPPPTAALNLTAGASSGAVNLFWTADPSASYYQVSRVLHNAARSGSIASPTTSTYTDAAGVPGTSYDYYVQAFNPAGYSGPVSGPVDIVFPPPFPGKPANLSATAGNGQVSLTWAAGTNATSYIIYRSDTMGGPYGARNGANTVTGLSYVDKTTPNRGTYYYVVTATNETGESAYSNEAKAMPGLSNDAQFVSQTPPPATIRIGQTYPVTVTFKNVGTNTWNGTFQILSQNPYLNFNWGTNVILLSSGPTAPGQIATFGFNAVAPTAPGSYNFQWQMSEQYVGSFGDVMPPASITVTPAPPDFTVDLDVSSITLSLATGNVPGGGPAESLVTVVPLNGFTGTVTLSLSWLDAAGNSYSGSPGGINYWFDPAADYDPSTGLVAILDTNSQISTLSICACQGNPAPGNYQLVVTGTTATLSHSFTIPLTITN